MDNLIDLIGKQLTPDVVNALGSLSGTTSAQTQTALKAAVPSVVGALAKQGGTPGGAQQILDLLGKQTGGVDLLSNLTGMLGNSTSSQSLMSSGGDIVSGLMGGDTNKIVDTIASTAGIKGDDARRITPIVLAHGNRGGGSGFGRRCRRRCGSHGELVMTAFAAQTTIRIAWRLLLLVVAVGDVGLGVVLLDPSQDVLGIQGDGFSQAHVDLSQLGSQQPDRACQ